MGVEAFQSIFARLDHEETYVHIIAVDSLEMLTGRKPVWYTFRRPGETVNGDTACSSSAKSYWKDCYVQQQQKMNPKK